MSLENSSVCVNWASRCCLLMGHISLSFQVFQQLIDFCRIEGKFFFLQILSCCLFNSHFAWRLTKKEGYANFSAYLGFFHYFFLSFLFNHFFESALLSSTNQNKQAFFFNQSETKMPLVLREFPALGAGCTFFPWSDWSTAFVALIKAITLFWLYGIYYRNGL